MLWLALHLPLLSLEAFSASLPAAAGAAAAAPASVAAVSPVAPVVPAAPAVPVALVAEHRITAVDAVAAALGVQVGMKRATALALAPHLVLGEAAAARDAAALRAVAHAALAFTPAVTLQDGQATVLMEVGASLRLFGGLAALHERLRAVLRPLAHRVSIAAAPTALGAAMLARWRVEKAEKAEKAATGASRAAGAMGAAFDPVLGPHAGDLGELTRLLERAPVWLLGPSQPHWEALQGMGLKTLADLRALPRSGLARRFGAALLEDLDRALGVAPDPRRWIELPARFESRLELHQRADSAEQVLHAAAVLLARLVAWAQARHGRIAAFTLAMQHEPRHRREPAGPRRGSNNSEATELRVELAAPALDPAHLQLLLRERLARVTLAAPTLELRLRCRDLVSAAPPNGELFPTRGSEALGLARLLERLRARLGEAQVQRLEAVADHRPERASRGVPALGAVAAEAADGQGGQRAQRAQNAKNVQKAKNAKNVQGVQGVQGAKGMQGVKITKDEESPKSTKDVQSTKDAQSTKDVQNAKNAQWPAATQRPVWLLPEPLPLPERHHQPLLDGQPLQLLSGPERIEAGWWDGPPALRDYFIALAADGSLVWIWRRRLAALTATGEAEDEVQWMLQGRFA